MTIPAKIALKELRTGKAITKPTTRHEMLEVGRRLINKDAPKVITEVIRIALDEKHPEQMQALKLLMGRVAPASFYEKLADKAQAGSKVNIQINVVGPAPEPKIEDAVIVELKDV
jgi:hypothetical protein